MASITLERVTKVYGEGRTPAVHDLDLTVEDGELLVLVGPSGCGKSTTLRLIAGLESPSAGRIRIDGHDVTTVPPQDRDLAMVFQSYALYPHRTVRQNMAFGLRMRNVDRAEIARRVDSAAEALGIVELLDRKPAQLSGGQRQRVALGRAIVREPRAFLFDEPLSNLDPRLRVQARAELTLLHRRLRATMIHVTHDQEEAMTLGDRVAVLRNGEMQQCDEPAVVYRRPANVFVAQFIGSPEMNLFACRIDDAGSSIRLVHPAFTLTPGTDTEPTGDIAGTSVTLGIRPHDISIVPVGEADARGEIRLVELLGSTVLVHVQLANAGEEVVRVLTSPDDRLQVDQTVGLRFDRRSLHLFDGRTGERAG